MYININFHLSIEIEIKKEEGEIQKGKASNHYKRDLEAAKLAYVDKTTESITSQKLGSHDFW